MIKIPEAFIKHSLDALPQGTLDAFLAALEMPHARGMRLRPGVQISDIEALLPDAYVQIPWAHGAYAISTQSTAGAHVLHAAGAYYLQEPSAMAAAAALDVQPGMRVLDLCAAPGGKSTQIAAALGGHGVLVANEYVPARAKVLSQNIERIGVRGAVVTNAAPDFLAARWPGWFDRVLVDVPCSGEGMFRRDPATRAEWTAESPGGCAVRQRQILASAAEMVAEGGCLVYSTCTFNTCENEENVAWFLGAFPGFVPEDFTLEGAGASSQGMLRLWPHLVHGEGHFVARLRKTGRAQVPVPVGDSVALFGGAGAPGALVESGSKRWLFPQAVPPLAGVRVLRSGLAVGEQRGKVFVPDHALAMAFPAGDFLQHVSLTQEEAARYLRGETLMREGLAQGWMVASFAGLSLGWVKNVDGVLKNHLPKGLRRMK